VARKFPIPKHGSRLLQDDLYGQAMLDHIIHNKNVGEVGGITSGLQVATGMRARAEPSMTTMPSFFQQAVENTALRYKKQWLVCTKHQNQTAIQPIGVNKISMVHVV
jgi:hypothetical protein